jgi:hypothetical protein
MRMRSRLRWSHTHIDHASTRFVAHRTPRQQSICVELHCSSAFLDASRSTFLHATHMARRGLSSDIAPAAALNEKDTTPCQNEIKDTTPSKGASRCPDQQRHNSVPKRDQRTACKGVQISKDTTPCQNENKDQRHNSVQRCPDQQRRTTPCQNERSKTQLRVRVL